MDGFLVLFIFLLIFFVIIGSFAWGGILAAPWVPLRKRDIERILRLCEIQKGDCLVDLGCGDGRILLVAAEKFGTEKNIGYEVSILPFLICYFKIIRKGLLKKIRVKFKNFFKENIGYADVVTAFLTPRAMEKLKDKFQNELREGARVVSYAFSIKGWEPYKIDKPNKDEVGIYIYKIKK